MHESPRIARLAGSATLGLAARAAQLRSAGRDVLSMAVGEPDFNAPLAARQAALEAVESGAVKYTEAHGALALREAIVGHLHETRGVQVSPDQVVVAHSCKHALASALQALVEPGDEVLLCSPAWNSYDAMVELAEGRPVPVQPRADLGPDLEAMAAAITPRTKGVMLNTPSNPSGYVWTRAEVEALVALAEEHDLWILSDEIYRRLVYEGEAFATPLAVSPEAQARTVLVDGASKSYAMTGYRIGYLVGPPEIASGVARLQSQTTGCPNYLSQKAYQAVLTQEPPEVEAMAQEFSRRRELLLSGLERLGLPTPRPRGAFYAFPDVSGIMDERGAAGLCEDLLEDQGLAVVPGPVFGREGHVRLSYAIKPDRIEEALARLGRFLEQRR